MEHKIDTDPLMPFSSRRDSPGTDMGQYPKSASQGIVLKIASEMPVPHSLEK